MSMDVEVTINKKYIEAIVAGEYNIQQAIDKFSLVLSACLLSGLSKVLIDYRNLAGEVYAVQEMLYAKKIIAQIKSYAQLESENLRFAYVGKVPQVSTYNPGLEMAECEYIKAIVTDDIDKAFQWLELERN